MKKFKGFRDVIDLWPTYSSLGDLIGVPKDTVRLWRVRNRIPGKYFLAIVEAADLVDAPVTCEILCELAAQDD